jgi:hypothetical protein
MSWNDDADASFPSKRKIFIIENFIFFFFLKIIIELGYNSVASTSNPKWQKERKRSFHLFVVSAECTQIAPRSSM